MASELLNCKQLVRIEERENNSFRFKREEHLKRRKEIREVFDKGMQYSCRGAKLFVLKNNLSYNRICFTVARGSKAVLRNRSKRLGREAFRLMKNLLVKGYDLILLVYPKMEEKAVLQDRVRQLEFLFKKAGLLNEIYSACFN